MSRGRGRNGRRHRVVVQRTIQVQPAGDRRQYINLPAGGAANRGRHITISAQIGPVQAGTTVHWTLQPDQANRPNLGNAARGGLVAVGAAPATVPVAATTSVTDGTGVARIVLRLSGFGGDRFRVCAGFVLGERRARSGWFTAWRRLWYQLTHDAGRAVPSLAPMHAAYDRVEALVEQDGATVTYNAGWLNGVANYYPLQMVQPGAATNPVVPVIGTHNQGAFANLFVPGVNEKHQRKAHVIVIGAQYDPIAPRANRDPSFTFRGDVVASPCELVMARAVLNPSLRNPSWFVRGSFKLKSQWGGWRPLAIGDIQFPANRGAAAALPKARPRYIQVTLPLGPMDPPPTALAPYVVWLELVGVDGPYKGVSFGNGRTANVCTPENAAQFPSTVAHEIGHAVNQSPINDDVTWSTRHPGGFGLVKHPHAYHYRGGQGPHCHSVHNGGIDGPGATIWDGWSRVYDPNSGTCIMFHRSHAGCRNEFCSVCEPYLRAEPMTSLQ